MIGKDYIYYVLKSLNIPFELEYKFLEKRKFRFDFALLQYKIAIEFEGIMSSKSRHTSITGYTKDTEKYNLATINDWKVLRYTVLNYKDFLEHIQILAELWGGKDGNFSGS